MANWKPCDASKTLFRCKLTSFNNIVGGNQFQIWTNSFNCILQNCCDRWRQLIIKYPHPYNNYYRRHQHLPLGNFWSKIFVGRRLLVA